MSRTIRKAAPRQRHEPRRVAPRHVPHSLNRRERAALAAITRS